MVVPVPSPISDTEAKESLRRLADAFGYVVFIMGLLLGVTLMLTEPERFMAPSWVYLRQFPHLWLFWGLPPVVAATAGIVGLLAKKYIIGLVSTLACSLWAFVMGCFLAAALGLPQSNPWWPLLMWFLSISYTMLGLSFTERYL